MAKQFFTNKNGNTLIKEFEGLLAYNPSIKCLDSVVGFLRASGYFTLRLFFNSIDKVRILIGIDVDKYIANAHNKGQMFFGAEEVVKQDYFSQLRHAIESSSYSSSVEDGIFQLIEDLISGKLELRAILAGKSMPRCICYILRSITSIHRGQPLRVPAILAVTAWESWTVECYLRNLSD